MKIQFKTIAFADNPRMQIARRVEQLFAEIHGLSSLCLAFLDPKTGFTLKENRITQQ